ncbi:MAG TPA: siphovirus ReqiPepy6 Gp37-like family protein [Candidatus Ruthenibacterium merdipullorum]|nr:siphovirus ReqiPepy6 Gp37-like family protein [Candidatus Ruthenibacterium merdipullorum]
MGSLEINILDKNRQLLHSIDVFRTLIWTRCYTEPGRFDLYCYQPDFSRLREGVYLCTNRHKELGRIDTLKLLRSRHLAFISGSFSEAEYNDRIIESVQDINTNREDAILSLLDDFAVSARPVPCRPVLAASQQRGGDVAFQVTGKPLGDYVYTLAYAAGLSLRNVYDFPTDTLRAEVWQGLDRRSSQTDNPLAIFGGDEENVKLGDYTLSTRDEKNVAWVAGEGEGAERVIVEVDRTNGAPRKELWVNAADIRKESSSRATLTDEEYRELLVQRGDEKLAKYKRTESAAPTLLPQSNLVYGKDFDLGDLAEYHDDEAGIMVEARITKVVETYEGGEEAVEIYFGDEEKKIMQKVKREASE